MKMRALVLLMAACVGTAHAARDPQKPPIAAESGPHPAAALRGQVTLPNASFEAEASGGRNCPPHWNCSMHADPTSYVFLLEAANDAPQGKQVLCIERLRPEPWSIATQPLDAKPLRGARVRVSAAVRIDEATALGVRAGPWLLVKGQYFNTEFQERPVPSTKGWERISVEAPVSAESFTVEVGVTSLGGGRACFDDIRLEVLP